MPLDIRRVPDHGLRAGGGDSQGSDLQEEVTLFEGPAAVGTYEGEGLGGELEGDGLGLTWLEGDLREVTQALVVWYDAGHEVRGIQQHGFLSSTRTCILYIDSDSKDIVGSERSLVHLQVRILIGGIADAIAEGPLQRYLGIVVIGAFHRTHLLRDLIVVGVEGIDLTRIGVRHLGREVHVAGKEVDEGIGTVVAWDEDIHHRLGEGFDIGDEARTAFIQDQDNRLARLGEGLHEVALVL